MNRTLHGKVHGRTIELEEDLGVAEGQEVEVQLTPVVPDKPPISATDLLTSGLVGIWADRDNIGDSLDFARRLRQDAQTRRRDP